MTMSVASSISRMRTVCPSKWWSICALCTGMGLLYHSVSVEGAYLGTLFEVRRGRLDARSTYHQQKSWLSKWRAFVVSANEAWVICVSLAVGVGAWWEERKNVVHVTIKVKTSWGHGVWGMSTGEAGILLLRCIEGAGSHVAVMQHGHLGLTSY